MSKLRNSLGGMKTGYSRRNNLSVSHNTTKNRDEYNIKNEVKRYPNGVLPFILIILIVIIVLFIALSLDNGYNSYDHYPTWEDIKNIPGSKAFLDNLTNKMGRPDGMSLDEYHNELINKYLDDSIFSCESGYYVNINGVDGFQSGNDFLLGGLHWTKGIWGSKWYNDFMYSAIVGECLAIFWWIGRSGFMTWMRYGFLKFNRMIKLTKIKNKMQLYVINPATEDILTCDDFSFYIKKRIKFTRVFFNYTWISFSIYLVVTIVISLVANFAF